MKEVIDDYASKSQQYNIFFMYQLRRIYVRYT